MKRDGVFTLGDARSFVALTSKIPPLGSTLNFDADVKKMTARHRRENLVSCGWFPRVTGGSEVHVVLIGVAEQATRGAKLGRKQRCVTGDLRDATEIPTDKRFARKPPEERHWACGSVNSVGVM